MGEDRGDRLAGRFEEHRARLGAVAYRILGSRSDADDAVQETWLRLSRSDHASVQNLGGWLTTVVARVCLSMLSARRSRPEEPLPAVADGEADDDRRGDPAQEAELAEAVGVGLLVVLDTLTPAERVAFVLHDVFDVPFEQVAQVLGRSPAATRQLASRARRRVRPGSAGAAARSDPQRQREVVTAFLAASRAGRFDALLALLDPDAVMRLDAAAARLGGTSAARGAEEVARLFAGRARGARLALVDGLAGVAGGRDGDVGIVIAFTVVDGRIRALDVVADAARIRALSVRYLEE